MANGIYSAVTGAVAQTRVIETIANNLANVSTTGFKSERISFAEVLAKAQNSNSRGAVGNFNSFVKVDEARTDMRPGMFRHTDNPMDLALEGKGFLSLLEDDQPVYSKGGSMRINADKELTDLEGRIILGKNDQPIRLSSDTKELLVEPDGTVKANGYSIGQIKLVEFERPGALLRLGNNTVTAPPEAGERETPGTRVRQGFLENSNVNPVIEVSSMIVASRAYENMHTVMTTFKELDSRVANELGRE